MTTINFLPWREQRKQQRQYYFIVMLSITLAMTMGLFATIFININNRYQYRREQQSIVDKKYQTQMQQQRKYIHILQQKRQLVAYLIANRKQQKAQQNLLKLLRLLQNSALLSISRFDYDKHSLIIKAIIPAGKTLKSIKSLLSQHRDIGSMTIVNLSSHQNTNSVTIELVLSNE